MAIQDYPRIQRQPIQNYTQNQRLNTNNNNQSEDQTMELFESNQMKPPILSPNQNQTHQIPINNMNQFNPIIPINNTNSIRLNPQNNNQVQDMPFNPYKTNQHAPVRTAEWRRQQRLNRQ